MNRCSRAAAALWIGVAGCSAPNLCEEPRASSLGLGAESEQVQDSVRALDARDGKDWKIRATLSGLPELWQGDSAILNGTLTVAVSVAYEGEPVGGDGVTEMPALSVTLGGLARELGSNQTSKFPGPEATQFSAPIFETCFGENQENCCPYGVRECSVPATLRVERLDGAPYPPIVVGWSARSSARVSTCPRGDAAPTLALALEAP